MQNAPERLTHEEVAKLRCSFCGKKEAEVQKLVVASRQSPDVAICDECFVFVAEIMTGETPTVLP
jgi:ATP-dependent protease Clp ATPase subunit